MVSAGVRRVVWGGIVALVAAVACAPASAAAAPDGPGAVPGELIVGYHDGVGASRRAAVRDDLGVRRIRPLHLSGPAELVADDARTPAELEARAAEIARAPGVEYAEPNWYVTPDAAPTDEYFASRQWALRNTGSFAFVTEFGEDVVVGSRPGADIGATQAWDVTTGSPNVVVAIVDTGVDVGHEDLDERIWTNPGEVVNGVDDDGNGVRDDTHGADFIGGAPDSTGHGTHVAGIVAGEANGKGTVGVAWNTSILPVRALRGAGASDLATAAEGVRYAAGEGAKVVNMSFGSSASSVSMTQTVLANPQTLFVASAGNNARNTDLVPYFPCSISAPNLVCVASTSADDQLAASSSYGLGSVELAAPGDRIINAGCCGSGYVYMSGTSMATAAVSGIAALMAAAAPWAGPAEQKRCLMESATRLPVLATLVRSGRANSIGALRACGDHVAPEVAPQQLAPRDGARVRSKGLAFDFVPGRDSHSGVVSNTVVMDGRAIATGEAVAAGIARVKVRSAVKVRDGRHRWLVRSADRFGNATDSATRTLIVDGTAPTVRVTLKGRSAKRGIRLGLRMSEGSKVSASAVRGRATSHAPAKNLAKGANQLALSLPKRLGAKAGRRVVVTLSFSDTVGNKTRKRLAVVLR